MTRVPASEGAAIRALSWLKTPSDLAILGTLWLVTSLPIVTTAWATCALFTSLRARDEADAERLLQTYVDALRSTFPHAWRLSSIVMPIVVGQAILAISMILSPLPVSSVALGALAIGSAVWCAFLLTLHAHLCWPSPLPTIAVARVALRDFLLRPLTPLLAVLVAATIVAAAAQALWVSGVFAASLPAWIVYRSHHRRTAEHQDEAS